MYNPLTVTTVQIADRIFGVNTTGNLVNQYLNLVVPELVVNDGEIRCSGEQITASAYVNNGRRTIPTSITVGKRNTFGGMLLLLKSNAVMQDYVTFAGNDTGAITVSNSDGELFSYSQYAVQQSFMGKGTPNQIKQSLNLMNLWCVFMRDVQKKSSSVAIKDKLDEKDLKVPEEGTYLETEYKHHFMVRDLRVMVKEFLGMDCN